MALPIAPTPVLTGQDAKNFDRIIEHGLKNPVYPVPTPKLENAKRLIKEYANRLKKQC